MTSTRFRVCVEQWTVENGWTELGDLNQYLLLFIPSAGREIYREQIGEMQAKIEILKWPYCTVEVNVVFLNHLLQLYILQR